jgi:hypothetical protein
MTPLTDCPENHSQVFQDGGWRSILDFRGKTAFDLTSCQFSKMSSFAEVPSHFIIDEATEWDSREHPNYYPVTAINFSKRSESETVAITIEETKHTNPQERDAMFAMDFTMAMMKSMISHAIANICEI